MTTGLRWPIFLGVAALGFACSGEDAPTDGGVSADARAGDTGVPPGDGGVRDTGGVDRDGGTPGDGACVFTETFSGGNASSWPAAWTISGNVEIADVVDGWGRLVPRKYSNPYSLARISADACGAVSAEVTYRFRLMEQGTQGVGVYLRSNGGFLQDTTPRGLGYVAFAENFRDRRLGIWKEVDGVEIELDVPAGTPVEAGRVFQGRFRMNQESDTHTRLQAKIWPEGEAEPQGWQLDILDDAFEVQGVAGRLAIDSYSTYMPGDPETPADMFIDDIVVTPIGSSRPANPLSGVGNVERVNTGYVFTEGPRWRIPQGDLLFSDLRDNKIHRLEPPSTITVFRDPSDDANGLAFDPQSRLLAAEASTRRVSVTADNGDRTTVASMFEGGRLGAPNDIAVRSDGTIYFTDPAYGLNEAQREVPFNGVYRVTPAPNYAISAEWRGTTTQRPNGVALSPDEQLLYVADTNDRVIRVWDVQSDGALANVRDFAATGDVPDGMAVDTAGNVYQSTSAGIQVFAPDGTVWGTIPVAEEASNCAFGGADGRTLYITARTSLYRVQVPIAGIR